MLRDAFSGARSRKSMKADRPSAAEIARERVGDRHREADRHCGVHRVAAGFQDRHAHVRRDGFHGDHHAVSRALWLTDGAQRNGQNEDQDNREGASHTCDCNSCPANTSPRALYPRSS